MKAIGKLFFLSIIASLTTGCSSMLTIGQSEVDGCKGVPDSSGKCLSAMEVYQLTNNGNPIITTKEKKTSDSEYEDEVIEKPTDSVEKNKEEPINIVKSKKITLLDDSVPVRSAPTVMRIFVNFYEDKNGDLIAPSHIYSEIEPRKWSLGEKSFEKPNTKKPLTNK